MLGMVALAGGLGLAALLAPPANAQFFDDRYPFFDPRGRQRFWNDSPPAVEERPVDYSRAPAPAARPADAPAPTTTVMVLGDSLADWLSLGLEEALSDTPEIAVVRKHKAYSGLIRYETRSDQEWPQVARDLLASVKPNIVVMLVGLQDRQSIRDKFKQAAKPGTPEAEKKADPAADAKKPEQDAEQPVIAAPEPSPQVAKSTGPFEFRSEKWEEVYGRRVDETIAAMKSSGAAVVWVGLPAIRGTRSTSDASYLNEIYRARAEKAGIFYVDVWDGFVDEQGRFVMYGPDVEGQNRRLRTADGVHFTKFGARKLAHYVERELRRVLINRNQAPAVASLPAPEKVEQQAPAKPGAPAPRPLAGPVLFLNTPARDSGDLLGGPSRSSGDDNAARRILVKGEVTPAAIGRADDFVWPLRTPNTRVDQPLPPTGTPVAVAAPDAPAQQESGAQPATPGSRGARVAGHPVLSGRVQPQQPPARQPQQGFWRSAPQYSRPPSDGFFGLFR